MVEQQEGLSLLKIAVDDFQLQARVLVCGYVNAHLEKENEIPVQDVYVVWFCKTLQNWKALLSTTIEDGKYYEVTHNGDREETYLDVYHKQENLVVQDT